MRQRNILLLAIPLALSAFTHLWNPLGYPSLHVDEGHYMRKAMSILDGTGIDPLHRYAAPYFGQIFLAGVLGIVGYPDSLNLSDTGNGVLHSVEMLYLVPRVLMGLLAVADTFLIYKITERRYHNRNVALIAAILFAVVPFGWLFRRIFLETIQVPFLLTSILLAVYVKDLKIEKNNSAARYKTISMILLSGAFLGLSIFTKVPVFAMIPLVGFLIYTNNTNGHKLRNLGLWFIPVILIPLIWPAHAMIIGEFDQWIHGILWQTTGRPSSPLSGTLKTFFQNDPILFVLSMAGLIYAAVKRDFFLLLWVIPFLIFLYFIGYVSSFHLMPLVPAFCIAASRFLVEIPRKIKIIKKYNLQQILPFAIISGIIIFGLVSTTMLITTNVNSSVYKALAVIVQKLPNKDDNTSNTSLVSLVASPIYFPMPRHGFDKVFYEKSYFNARPLESERYIVVADRGFMRIMSGTNDRPSTILMKSLYDNSQTIDTLVPDDKTKYKLNSYPYSSMRQSPAAKEIEITSSIAKAQLTTEVKPITNTTGNSKQNGTPADDNLRGSDQNDVIVGLAGNDIITGQAGDDNIDGSEG
ncbi:MAG TPA: hypothetical protein VE076_07125, partial [Nitrososphaeraceae archaeon]|nr:hypothetical protein [Nitrososphaeraceae archaeon]